MIAVLVGTRPELIKVAPILRKLSEQNIPHIFIHSNQHYSFEMDKKILQDLNLRDPDYNLNVGSSSHATQTGKIMEGVEQICKKHKPSIILVHGDTNTTLGGALAAKKLHIKVGHIEAGLRSFDYRMPEEINRILVDRISDVLFAPTQIAKQNLLNEGVNEKQIIVTGNTVVDALYDHIELTNSSSFLKDNKLVPDQYILVTAHRAENVDSKASLAKLVALIEHAAQTLKKPVVYPMHPRTQSKLQEFGIHLSDSIRVFPPVGYIEMLALLKNSHIVLTDSGGVQEEAYILKKPLITLRDSTERPETLSANFIVHNDTEKFDAALQAYSDNSVHWDDSFGNGTASATIINTLLQFTNIEKTVTVLGLGYIGLPTALLLAQSGVQVSGFDVDSKKITSLKKGKLFFDEPGLDQLFSQVKEKNTFSPTTKLQHSDVYIIAVPTPQKKGSADLQYVFKALEAVEKVFEPGDLIIIESTIGPRDCVDEIIPIIQKWNKHFLFAHCPERAIPGNTLTEMVSNDRIIGGMDEASRQVTKHLYTQFVTGNLYVTDTTTAAACKVMENTYRAVNIALANEFAGIAEKLDFDVWEAIQLANKHPRVNIHTPGPGVGGHCIPIDPWFFVEAESTEESLIEKSLHINEEMARKVSRTITRLLKKHSIHSPNIALLGYAYKKNVDDPRETPTEPIYQLLSKKYNVMITDPYIAGDKRFVSLNTVLKKANTVVLTTDHDVYREIDFSKYPNIQVIYDTRNIFSEKNCTSSSTTLYKLGRNDR